MRATLAYEPFSTRWGERLYPAATPNKAAAGLWQISLCVQFADPANQYKREQNKKLKL
jgi:hypothetical protein